MTKHVIYVYGTLRPGLNTDIVLVLGRMYDLGGFPGAIIAGPDTPESVLRSQIVCERVEVDDEGLQRLDWLEGYREDAPKDENFYLRVPCLDGWIYVINRPAPSKHPIVTGDWLAYKGQLKGHNSHLVKGY